MKKGLKYIVRTPTSILPQTVTVVDETDNCYQFMYSNGSLSWEKKSDYPETCIVAEQTI